MCRFIERSQIVMKKIVELDSIQKKFKEKVIFDSFSCTIYENEFVAIIGKSGCGKSTLLNMIGLLDSPDSGEIILFGEKGIKPFSKKATLLLKSKIGYLFQNFALIENKTVYENLQMAINEKNNKTVNKYIEDALKKVGLNGYSKKYIYECSGGEQQRIALARLLVKPCELILADEPTGSLDEENKQIVIKLLKEFKKEGCTIIMVTHDIQLAEECDRVIALNGHS